MTDHNHFVNHLAETHGLDPFTVSEVVEREMAELEERFPGIPFRDIYSAPPARPAVAARVMALAGADTEAIVQVVGVAPEPQTDEITRLAEQLDPADFEVEPLADLDGLVALLSSEYWLETSDPEATRAHLLTLAHRQLDELFG